MIKQCAILTRQVCWISAIMSIVSWPFAIVANQLSATSTKSSFASASSAPLKFCFVPSLHFGQGTTFRPELCRREFYPSLIHSSCKYAQHVQLICKSCRTTVVEFAYTFVTSGMFSRFLIDNTPQSRHCARSYLSLWP